MRDFRIDQPDISLAHPETRSRDTAAAGYRSADAACAKHGTAVDPTDASPFGEIHVFSTDRLQEEVGEAKKRFLSSID